MKKVTDFIALKRRVEMAKASADKAAGALSLLKKDLQKKWGCKTIGEAKKKKEGMQTQLDKLQKEFDELMATFEKEWGGKLDELNSN